MKKIILGALIGCAAPVVLTAQVEFTLKGKIGNLNGAKLLLRYNVDDKNIADSAILKNGAFTLKGKLNEPVQGFVTLYHDGLSPKPGDRIGDATRVYLEKGTITMNSKDSVKNAEIKGSKLNDDYKRLMASMQPVYDRSGKLSTEYRALTAEQKKDTALMASYEKQFDVMADERRAAYRKFIEQNPSSHVSLDMVRMAIGSVPSHQEVTEVYGLLSKDLQASTAGKKIAEQIDRLRSLGVGQMAPDFTQNDTSGVPVKLSSFRGKYVLVDFWASWCGPCRAENPNVVKSYNKYKDKNFTVLGVSLDQPTGKEKWLKAIKDDQLFWTQVSDLAFWNNAAAKVYEVHAIPQNYLIGPDGKIVGRDLRGDALEKKLAELLN